MTHDYEKLEYCKDAKKPQIVELTSESTSVIDQGKSKSRVRGPKTEWSSKKNLFPDFWVGKMNAWLRKYFSGYS
jgi:hypothetical protein